jgi:NADH-quinone oxidoreductase subunit M
MTSPSALPVLSLLLWIPAWGALLALCLGARARRAVALASAAIAVLVSGFVWLGSSASPPLRELRPWVPSLGISYELATDELGGALALSVALVALVALTASDPAEGDGRSAFLLLVGESALLGVVMARDVFLLLAFLGASILSFTFLASRTRALRFFLFQSAGLLLATGFSLTWYQLALVQSGFPTGEILRFAGLVTYPDFECRTFLLGAAAACFAAPLFPFGSWLQDTVDSFTPSGRALFFGGFSVVSAVILLRLVLPSVPVGRSECSGLPVYLAALSTIYAAVVPARGEPARSFVPILVGAQGIVMLGLLSSDTAALGAGRLSLIAVALGLSAFALWSDGESHGDLRLPKWVAALLILFVVWLPSGGGAPSVWVILRSYWERFPLATALAAVGSAGMALRLVRTHPLMARRRGNLLRVLPLLAWWLVAAASLPGPGAPTPAEELSEAEE